jgi:hypothetical protein
VRKPERWFWNVSWWSDPRDLGVPGGRPEVYGHTCPRGTKKTDIICQKLLHAQNIYNVPTSGGREWTEQVAFRRVPPNASRGMAGHADCCTGPKFLCERYKLRCSHRERHVGPDGVSLGRRVHDARG